VLELPELEVTRDRLRLALVGRRIVLASVPNHQCLVTRHPAPASLAGGRIKSVTRHGRALVFETDSDAAMAVRFGRNGRIALRRHPAAPGHGVAFTVTFADDGSLDLLDPGRKLRLEVALARKAADLPWLGRGGLDPFDPGFTLSALRSTLARNDRTLRNALSDTHVIAGPLDAFADEALFEARLSPFHSTALLRPDEAVRLHLALKKTLAAAAIHYKALPADVLPDETARDFVRVWRRAGQPCAACGSPVRTVREGYITAHYCPHCQAGGIELADRNVPTG
jgi:formamidopyrimidine-DNA glycosylase